MVKIMPWKPANKSIVNIAKRVNDPTDLGGGVSDEVKQKLTESAQWQMQHDAAMYRGALATLSIIGVATLVGVLVLAWYSKAIPESVIALGSASVGALAGLISPTPTAST